MIDWREKRFERNRDCELFESDGFGVQGIFCISTLCWMLCYYTNSPFRFSCTPVQVIVTVQHPVEEGKCYMLF